MAEILNAYPQSLQGNNFKLAIIICHSQLHYHSSYVCSLKGHSVGEESTRSISMEDNMYVYVKSKCHMLNTIKSAYF